MTRRTTAIIAMTAVGAIAVGSAAALGVSAAATAVPVDQAVEVPAAPQNFYGTTIVLPENIVAFHLDEAGQLVTTGDSSSLSTETVDSVSAQLAAAPANSVMYVDANSDRTDGLTTALATVTPTNGFIVGGTNEDLQAWLTGLFPGVEGTTASLPIEGVPNASFTYQQVDGELTWQITEYVFQYADATVSVRLATVDATGATRAQFDQMLSTMTR